MLFPANLLAGNNAQETLLLQRYHAYYKHVAPNRRKLLLGQIRITESLIELNTRMHTRTQARMHANIKTHTRLMAFFPGQPG